MNHLVSDNLGDAKHLPPLRKQRSSAIIHREAIRYLKKEAATPHIVLLPPCLRRGDTYIWQQSAQLPKDMHA